MAKFSDESVAAALRGRGEVRRYLMPGSHASEIYVGVKVPSDAELDGARLRAVDYCKKRKVDPRFDPDFLEHAIEREIVALAFVDIETLGNDGGPESFFQDAEQVAALDKQMVTALHEVYLMHFHAMDPYASVSGEELKELEDALGKSSKPEEMLSFYDLRTLRALLLSMALRQRETQPSHKLPTT